MCHTKTKHFPFPSQSPQPKPVGRKNSSVEESWEEEKARRDAEEKEREEQASKEEKEKASLVASFFGGTASKPATSRPVAVAKPANRTPMALEVVERASFTPNTGTEIKVITSYFTTLTCWEQNRNEALITWLK